MSSSNYETASSELTTTDESAASCLMLLSKVGELSPPPTTVEKSFNCKTCGKIFPTFQALGGHRASHKKPKLDQPDQSPSPTKPRSHKCSICGAEFALGQALGGHMRRHRDSSAIINKKVQSGGCESETTTTVLMRSNSKRVWLNLDLDLNLNLKPPERDDDFVMTAESDLKLRLGKRDYEMKKSMDFGSLLEYDLRMQMGKRRRLGDACFGLVV